MSSAVGAVTGSRLTAAQRKQQFLDVAAQIVVEQGADTVTMEAVAARAGVSKALSYRYFSNAGSLLLELFEREVVELDRQIRVAVELADTFEDKIRANVPGLGRRDERQGSAPRSPLAGVGLGRSVARGATPSGSRGLRVLGQPHRGGVRPADAGRADCCGDPRAGNRWAPREPVLRAR